MTEIDFTVRMLCLRRFGAAAVWLLNFDQQESGPHSRRLFMKWYGTKIIVLVTTIESSFESRLESGASTPFEGGVMILFGV